jgi:hypothetical protein
MDAGSGWGRPEKRNLASERGEQQTRTQEALRNLSPRTEITEGYNSHHLGHRPPLAVHQRCWRQGSQKLDCKAKRRITSAIRPLRLPLIQDGELLDLPSFRHDIPHRRSHKHSPLVNTPTTKLRISRALGNKSLSTSSGGTTHVERGIQTSPLMDVAICPPFGSADILKAAEPIQAEPRATATFNSNRFNHRAHRLGKPSGSRSQQAGRHVGGHN